MRAFDNKHLEEWADNGELLYRGRKDDMLIISGYRIEPGEVEVVLTQYSGTFTAYVMLRM